MDGLTLMEVTDSGESAPFAATTPDTLFATADGVVKFEWTDKGRQKISVYPEAAAS